MTVQAVQRARRLAIQAVHLQALHPKVVLRKVVLRKAVRRTAAVKVLHRKAVLLRRSSTGPWRR
jgi:hypothetical protein